MNGNLPRLLLILMMLAAGLPAGLRGQNPVPAVPRSILPRDPSVSTIPPASTPAAALPQAATPPAAPAASGQPAVAASADYVLAPSDSVEMTVFREPDLSTQTRIASDGTAQFPLIGEVRIAGMVLRDARELVRRRYNADYLVEPQVYLNVIGYAQRKFTILGQVAKPGTFEFPPGEHLTLLEAVGIAGGFTRLADQGKVSIQRSSQGGERTLKVNARKLTAKGSRPFELAAGDVITVGESWF